MNDKITKIVEILDKYNFVLLTTDVANNDDEVKEKIIQEMMHSNLNEIADALASFGNCIKEIMMVVHDVKESEK